MVDLINYSSSGNLTSFPAAIDYASVVATQATGYDILGPLTLVFIFFGFYAIAAKYSQEQSMIFASFMTMVASFLMTAGHFLEPQWVLLTVVMTMGSMFLGGGRS